MQAKVHNTAETSKECFIAISNEGRLIDEKQLCFEAIKKYGPVTSRSLSKLIDRERTNVTRSIYDLLNEINPSIKVCYQRPCPITARRVKWYSVIDWQEVLPIKRTMTFSEKLSQGRLQLV